MSSVIKKPVVTEKYAGLQEKGVYVFEVDKSCNKLEVKKAVEAMYGVTVNTVRTYIVAGKSKTRFTKTGILSGRTASKKRAIVTLTQGEVIDLYSDLI
jgi:large subunit ribosomal protein L23